MIDSRFTPEKQQEVKQIVVDSLDTIKNHNRVKLERRWKEQFDLYRGLTRHGSYKGRADLDWASAYIAVETMVPRLYRTLFPRSKWFAIDGIEQSDEKQAKLLEAYLRTRFEKPIRIRTKMIPYLRYLAIYGTLICKTPFRNETKNVPTKTRNEENEIEETEKKVTIWDDIDLQLVDLYDFFVADDTINSVEEQPFVIHQTSKTFAELKRDELREDEDGNKIGTYENLDKLKLIINTSEIETEGQDVEPTNPNVLDRYRELGIAPRSYKHTGPEISIKEYQGKLDILGEEEDFIVTVANDKVVIQAEVLNTPDREKTYVKAAYIEQPNEFFGMALNSRSTRTNHELNDRANQTMDVTSGIINPIWEDSGTELFEGKLKVFPNRIIKVNEKNSLNPLRPPTEVLAPAYAVIKELVSLNQDITGATRFLGGSAQTPELQRTATGIVSIIKEANARIDLVVQGIEDSFIKPFLRKSYKYAQFYSSHEQQIRIVGKHAIEYQKFSPSQILGDYDFRPLGSQSLGSEEIIAQQSINFLNVIATIPGLIERVDVDFLVLKIAQTMLGFNDADELLRTNKRIEEEIEKATSENQGFAKGVPAAVSPTENHRLHVEIHSGLLQDPRSEGLDPTVIQLLQEHINEHQRLAVGQGIMPIFNQQQQSGGVPPQSQPNPANPEDLINQLAQPSQRGQL